MKTLLKAQRPSDCIAESCPGAVVCVEGMARLEKASMPALEVDRMYVFRSFVTVRPAT